MNARANKPTPAPPALEVSIMSGPAAGTLVRFQEAPVSFGRDASHPLHIDLPTISRDHGYFDLQNGQWVVVNRSPNGLKLNRKTVNKRPAVLPHDGQIIIGDAPVLTFRLRDRGATTAGDLMTPMASTTSPGDAPYADGDPMHRPGKRITRAHLLMGVVGFWVVLFALLIVLQPGSDADTDATGRPALPVTRLTDAQLVAHAHTQSQPQANNDVLAEQFMAQAQEFYALRDVRPDAAYRAMDAYRNAASYLPGNTLPDPLLQRRHLDLQQQLSDDVTRRYRDIMGKLDSRRYAAAALAIDDLLDRFPDHEQGERSLHRHLRKLLDYARRKAGT